MLFVEDDPANQKLMEEISGRVPNLAMVSARDTEKGLELAKERNPDVIVMDISLPGANGFEALKMLRETEKTRHIPVIALTANAMRGDVERGTQAGFHRYLTRSDRGGRGRHRGRLGRSLLSAIGARMAA